MQSYSTRFTRSPAGSPKTSMSLLYVAVAWAFCYPAMACLIGYLIVASSGSVA